MNIQYIASPVGELQLVSDGEKLITIAFSGHHLKAEGEATTDAVLDAAAAQLSEYFAGARQRFELPLAATGTAFQKQVWQALTEIPYGELRSYRDIAQRIGKPNAVRAVGAANGRNPLPIVVPCHRVIGSNGSLTGFSGGLGIKQQLLEREGALALTSATQPNLSLHPVAAAER